MSFASRSQILTKCLGANSEAPSGNLNLESQWVTRRHPTPSHSSHTVNDLKKQKRMSRWWGQRGGWLILTPFTTHTCRTQWPRHDERLITSSSLDDNAWRTRWQHRSLARIRCQWVAANRMTTEGTMPAQAVRYSTWRWLDQKGHQR